MIAAAKDQALTVRFPSRSLLKELTLAARKNGRSRNSEIVFRLTESFRMETPVTKQQQL
jgi:hypothetical protein